MKHSDFKERNLKGTRTEEAGCPGTLKMGTDFLLSLHLVVLSIVIQKKYFFTASNLTSSGHLHVASLSTNEDLKMLARDVFNTLAIHAGLVDDVIDPECWVQSGRAHGRSFATFKCRVFINRSKRERERERERAPLSGLRLTVETIGMRYRNFFSFPFRYQPSVSRHSQHSLGLI